MLFPPKNSQGLLAALATAVLSVMLAGGSPALAQDVAQKLQRVERAISELEEAASQYRGSLDLLRDSSDQEDPENPAVEALQYELDQALTGLEHLQARREALRKELAQEPGAERSSEPAETTEPAGDIATTSPAQEAPAKAPGATKGISHSGAAGEPGISPVKKPEVAGPAPVAPPTDSTPLASSPNTPDTSRSASLASDKPTESGTVKPAGEAGVTAKTEPAAVTTAESEDRTSKADLPTAPEIAESTDASEAPLRAASPPGDETARLMQLLMGSSGGQSPGQTGTAAKDSAADSGADPGASGKRERQSRLNGPEAVAAIKAMSSRLETDTSGREMDIIFHIEVRREGRLVSSSSYSLSALGNAQYISKVKLQGGDARITVRSEAWSVRLEGTGEAEYLIAFNGLRRLDPELMVISVAELKETGWTDLPIWLPYIGISDPAGP